MNKRWTVKPPPGTPLIQGNMAPDRLCCPMNEYGGSTVHDYSAFSSTCNGTISGTASFNITQGKNGSRYSATATNAAVTWSYADLYSSAAASGFLPTTACTIMLGYRKRDATNRVATCFGLDNNSPSTYRIGAHVPYSDGIVYWDWENISTGRLTASGLTFGDDVWAFTGGLRGQEIWQNGILRATNSNTAGRTGQGGQPTDNWYLGQGNGLTVGTASDLADYDFVYMWSWQIPASYIQDLSRNPWSIFRPYSKRFPWGHTAVASTGFKRLDMEGGFTNGGFRGY